MLYNLSRGPSSSDDDGEETRAPQLPSVRQFLMSARASSISARRRPVPRRCPWPEFYLPPRSYSEHEV